MNRGDLQKLSESRIREARILLRASEYSGAYYLAGYAVECGLKACYARQVKRFDFPDRKSSRSIFTHSLIELVELSGLKKEIAATRETNRNFNSSWTLVCRWTEESRYSAWTQVDAEALLDAITRRRDGVLPWIKQRW